MPKILTMALAAGLLAGPLLASPAAAQTLCSGVGIQEREAADAGDFNLKLVYAEPGGHYLGDIRTEVLRGGEVVAEGDCPGPWFLTKLAPGRYEVRASFKGRTETRSVSVPASGRREVTIIFRP